MIFDSYSLSTTSILNSTINLLCWHFDNWRRKSNFLSMSGTSSHIVDLLCWIFFFIMVSCYPWTMEKHEREREKGSWRGEERLENIFICFWKILSKQTTRQGAILANFYELTSAFQHVSIFCFVCQRRSTTSDDSVKKNVRAEHEASVELFMTINILEIYDYNFFPIESERENVHTALGNHAVISAML